MYGDLLLSLRMSQLNLSAEMSSPNFDADAYVDKLIQEAPLETLITTESSLKADVRRLDSEMQTLVYENYNKFISATDTVSRMKMDFRAMEDDMQQLARLMQQIAECSGSVTSALQERREEIDRLSSTDETLKKLQFLFELPNKLREAIEDQNYKQAVEHYMHAQLAVEQYCHLPSLQQLHKEVQQCIDQLTDILRSRLQDTQTSIDQLTESTALLMRLGVSRDSELSDSLLDNMREQLSRDHALLKEQVSTSDHSAKSAVTTPQTAVIPMDVLQFMDIACSGFLSKLHACITRYVEIFNSDLSNLMPSLLDFVSDRLCQLCDVIELRLGAEQHAEPEFVARALDKLHHRLVQVDETVTAALPDNKRLIARVTAVSCGISLATDTVRNQCSRQLCQLQQSLSQQLHQLRVKLATCSSADDALADLLTQVLTEVSTQVTAAVDCLKVFCRVDLSFSNVRFRRLVCCRFIRESVVVEYFRHLASFSHDLGSGEHTRLPPSVLLIFCKLCREMSVSIVHNLMGQIDESLGIDADSSEDQVTPISDISQLMQTAALHLLDSFVRSQSEIVSQMLRGCVESRDWLLMVEPRCVRAVVRRVLEQMATVDSSVALLFEEGVRKERGSDSSRRSNVGYRRDCPSSYTSFNTTLDSNLAANIQKLFSDRVDLFSPLEFTRASLLTAIVKIALKTLSECVRLQTFSRFGLHQMQIDLQYLQIHLWRFVSDEKLLRRLLDDVMGSTLQRCVEPVLMDFSLVENLAERS